MRNHERARFSVLYNKKNPHADVLSLTWPRMIERPWNYRPSLLLLAVLFSFGEIIHWFDRSFSPFSLFCFQSCMFLSSQQRPSWAVSISSFWKSTSHKGQKPPLCITAYVAHLHLFHYINATHKHNAFCYHHGYALWYCSSKWGNITEGEKHFTFQNSSQFISQVIKSSGYTPSWQSIKMEINDLTPAYLTAIITTQDHMIFTTNLCFSSKRNLAR